MIIKDYEQAEKSTTEALCQYLISTNQYTALELSGKSREELLAYIHITLPSTKKEHWFPKYAEKIAFLMLIIAVIELFRTQWIKALILFVLSGILYVIAFLVHQKLATLEIKRQVNKRD